MFMCETPPTNLECNYTCICQPGFITSQHVQTMAQQSSTPQASFHSWHTWLEESLKAEGSSVYVHSKRSAVRIRLAVLGVPLSGCGCGRVGQEMGSVLRGSPFWAEAGTGWVSHACKDSSHRRE